MSVKRDDGGLCELDRRMYEIGAKECDAYDVANDLLASKDRQIASMLGVFQKIIGAGGVVSFPVYDSMMTILRDAGRLDDGGGE